MYLGIGQGTYWKFGLVSRWIERVSDCYYIIHDFSDGWKSVKIKHTTLMKIITHQKSIYSLKWK